MSPLSAPSSSSVVEESKCKSPATLMAEASLLSQEAAVRDADNLSRMINLHTIANEEEHKEEL
jgi:hypothetical protein